MRTLTLVKLALLLTGTAACKNTRSILGEQKAARYEDDGTRVNKTLGLITPEQFTGNIAAALGYDDPSDVRELMNERVLALGGIDFRTVHERNRVPTGQSALTIRRLAWDIAKKVVERDTKLRLAKLPPRTFKIANVAVDRPFLERDIRLPPEVQFAIQEGDVRYRDQLDELYWRLLSRPPSTREMEIATQLFVTTMENEDSAAAAWTAVVYLLLASMEYWNI